MAWQLVSQELFRWRSESLQNEVLDLEIDRCDAHKTLFRDTILPV